MEVSDDPDEVLFARAQAGDKAAYSDIIHRYQRPLYQFTFRLLNDAALAQDATQAALARGWLKRASFTFRGSARFSTWLFQLARNAAMDLLRRRREPLEEPREQIGPEPTPPEAMQQRELAERIATAIARLPEPQRVAITLAEYHDLGAKEIATILRCSIRAAESHLYRAKQTLRATLADCWEELHSS